MRKRTVALVLAMVASIVSLSAQDDQYLRYPYVRAKRLAKETEPATLALYEELNERVIAALNERTPMESLGDLFLTEDLVEPYVEQRLAQYDQASDQDAIDETQRAQAMLADNRQLWSIVIEGSAEGGFVYTLVDFGVHVESDTSYYFLLLFTVPQMPEPGPFPFLAEFVNGRLLITGLGLEPFVFSF
jgi:hypothetical protein